jgi:hypothetical protein
MDLMEFEINTIQCAHKDYNELIQLAWVDSCNEPQEAWHQDDLTGIKLPIVE